MSVENIKNDMRAHPKYVRYKEGAILYSMCQKTFEKLAKESKAVIKYGKLVLVKCEDVDRYLELFKEE